MSPLTNFPNNVSLIPGMKRLILPFLGLVAPLANAELASTFVNSDSTIRPLGSGSEMCAYKRWNSYTMGQDVWLWPCDPGHGSKKYIWEYDASTGLVTSMGSLKKDPTRPFCWWIKDTSRVYAQRLKIKQCDENELSQQFDYSAFKKLFSAPIFGRKLF